MSTSKGLGVAAHEIVEVVPPEQLRLLFLRPRPQSAIDFDPIGTDAIPRLFDEYDRLADATAGRPVRGELPAGHESVFRYSLLDPAADVAAVAAAFRPAFGHLALLRQIPGVDIEARIEAEKGGPLSAFERSTLAERTAAADAWLEAFAPERSRIAVRPEGLPDEAGDLDAEQRAWLGRLAAASGGGDAPAAGDAWQALIFSTAAELGLPPGRAFGALYLAFLGRANGPRAGWLLASLEPAFVQERLREAAAGSAVGEHA
jgi:lysyl-tRNA synthetase class 1